MNDRLGYAQWEPQPEVSRNHQYNFQNFWLGRAENETPIGYSDDRHICLVSGTRGGKGTSIIVNNLCYWPGSAVVIDPKGENATVTAARRGRGDRYCGGLGQAVHVLDPFKAAQVDDGYRSCFNPLDALDPDDERTIDEASRLANAIVIVKDEKADSSWDEAARAMVRALILHVVTAADFVPAERNLVMVRDLLKRGEWRLREEMQRQGETDIDPPQVLLWRSVEMGTAFDGIVAGDGSQFLSMLMTAPKQYQGVLQAALLHTEFLDSPGMRRVLATSDFQLSELKTRPEGLTLYLSLPQGYMDTHSRWLRMMVTLITMQMETTRGQPATGHPVLMVLDEFAGLKRMTSIENAVAQIAGFGVKLFFVLQSLEQLKATYKESWETFLSNAGLKIFFSIEDHFTREYVSKLIGETEIIRLARSENEGTSASDSLAEGTSRSASRSQGESRSSSVAHGQTQSMTTGSSDTVSRGRNYSETESRSEGTNWSQSKSVTDGTSESTNWSQGGSSSSSYGPGGGSSSSGSNWSTGGSQGTSHSVTEGESWGGSTGISRGWSFGVNEGESRGTSSSQADGTSLSRTSGDSTTSGTAVTDGTSNTITRGTGRTAGRGSAETIHRRLLLRPEEVGKMFARIDNSKHPSYPGFGLVLVTGGNPMVVKRTHYFEDLQFIDCFSPHPDHKFLSAVPVPVEGLQALIKPWEAALGEPVTIANWLIGHEQVVHGGQNALRINKVPPDLLAPIPNFRTAALKRDQPNFLMEALGLQNPANRGLLVPRFGNSVFIQVPCNGKVTRISAVSNTRLADGEYEVPADQLFTVKCYPGKEGTMVDPFAELRKVAERLRPAAEIILPPVEQRTSTSGDGSSALEIPGLLLFCLVCCLALIALVAWFLSHLMPLSFSIVIALVLTVVVVWRLYAYSIAEPRR